MHTDCIFCQYFSEIKHIIIITTLRTRNYACSLGRDNRICTGYVKLLLLVVRATRTNRQL